MALPLLALYALSVGMKSKRENKAAQAKAVADSKITNWAMGKNGIRALDDNSTLDENNEESLYGFTIGNSKQINVLPKEEKPNIDVFENPMNSKGPLISRLDFQALNKNMAGMDLTKPYTLGKAVGQRNPANNKLTFFKGYERFKKDADVETTTQQEGRYVQRVFVPFKKGVDTWEATHARQVTKSGTKNILGKPYKIKIGDGKETTIQQSGYYTEQGMFIPIAKDNKVTVATHTREVTKSDTKNVIGIPVPLKEKQKASDIITQVRYYNSEGEVTTNANEAVSFDKIKVIGDKTTVIEPKKDISTAVNQELTTLFDKDGKVTNDPSKAVQQRTDTYDKTGILKQGKLEEVKTTKTVSAQKSTEYVVTIKKKDGKIIQGLNTDLNITEKEVLSGETNDGEPIGVQKSRTYNKDNVASKFTDFNSASKAKNINSVNDGDNYGTITLKTNETDPKTFRKKSFQISMNRKFSGQQNLINFNADLIKNKGSVEQINSNEQLYGLATSNIVSEVRSYFNEGKAALDGAVIYKNLPKNPEDAINTIRSLVGNGGVAQIRDFDKIVLLAARMLGDEQQKELLAFSPRKEGESILVVKGKTTDGSTAFVGTNFPSDYEDIVRNKLPQYVKSSNLDNINAVIASLIKTKKNPDGSDMFTTNANGKQVRVLDDTQNLLGFMKDLDNKLIIGKKVNIKGVQRDATLLDGFFSIMHPYPSQSPVGTVTGDDRKYIVDKFNTLASSNFNEAMKVIMGFTDINQDMVDRTIEQLHGGDTGNIKVRQEIQGKSTSAFNAIITIDAMENTYTINGRDIDINTVQGELIVRISGAYETGKRALQLFRGGSLLDIVSSSVEEVNSQLVDQSEVYDSINSNDPLEVKAKEANQAKLAEIKKMMGGNFGDGVSALNKIGVGEASGFVKSLPKAMQVAYSQGKLGKEVIRKLAIRQYHKYMLAYQLAAAIQGGTGGRTISDQDVQNILGALNFGFFTEASLERATLQEAKKMMTSIYEYNTALLNKDTKVQYAAIKAREMLFEGNKAPYLGIGNQNSLQGVKSRRAFITNKLLNTRDSINTNNNSSVVDKEETQEADNLMKQIEINKNKKAGGK